MVEPTPPTTRAPELERAFALQKELETADLTIIDLKNQFKQKDFSGLTDSALSSNPSNPLIVAADVQAQQSFLRKLKFHYMEQHAKDKYVKILVSPDEPGIDAEDNEQLKSLNTERKRLLKEQKVLLAETYEKIRQQSLQVDKAYEHAESSTKEAATLTQQILDAKLALTRLRAAYPSPRLTASEAIALADKQCDDMAQAQEKLAELTTEVEQLKTNVKNGVKEVERLKVERAAKEEELKRTRKLEEDNRWPALNDWYQAAVSLHKSLLCLEDFATPTDNELRLTYSLPKGLKTTIQLIFQPGTRELEVCRIIDSDVTIDIEELVFEHTQSNDVPGLIRNILARLRAES
ncbi:hypothetical protein M422DRAFT_231010, partial [Sphaerobolus stellatus SS14]